MLTPTDAHFPENLHTIPQAPKQLYIASTNWEDILARPKVAIVGSRKITPYGKAATERFAADLALAGVVVVSGLAYGVDVIAHKAALEAGGVTVAVLPTALDSIYPTRHTELACSIVQQGGAIISEYASGTIPFKGNFVERNRIVSGFSDILLVTEAAAKSGTLHTADFALDQGRDIFAVPGNITSPTSEGTNNLIKMGAMLATTPQDVLAKLGITGRKRSIPTSSDPVEQQIITAIAQGTTDTTTLRIQLKLPVQHFNQALTMLEIKGIIENSGSNQWRMC